MEAAYGIQSKLAKLVLSKSHLEMLTTAGPGSEAKMLMSLKQRTIEKRKNNVTNTLQHIETVQLFVSPIYVLREQFNYKFSDFQVI